MDPAVMMEQMNRVRGQTLGAKPADDLWKSLPDVQPRGGEGVQGGRRDRDGLRNLRNGPHGHAEEEVLTPPQASGKEEEDRVKPPIEVTE